MEKVLGSERLKIYNVSRVAEVARAADGVRATIESLTMREKSVLECEVVVYSTGYRPIDPHRLLGEAAAACRVDERVRVGRDYRRRLDAGPGMWTPATLANAAPVR